MGPVIIRAQISVRCIKAIGDLSNPVKLTTTISKIDLISNRTNSALIKKFHSFMRSNDASERHQNNNLKAVIAFANFLGENNSFTAINKTEQVNSFLNTKIKNQQDDPEKKWITTWNDYLHRIKHFLRWLHNTETVQADVALSMDEWITPTFLKIKEKRTKRISPYLETELWEREDILLVTRVNHSLSITTVIFNKTHNILHDIEK